jgi:D-alanyl-D-alanine carboxypeptidase
MKNRFLLFLVATAFLACSFLSCSKKKDNPETPANQAMIEKLDHWGDSVTRLLVIDSVSRNAQGAIFCVIDPTVNLSYLKAFGTSDISTARYTPLQSSCLFRIGTFTNMLTATVFLQLVQNGALNLESKLSLYLPEVPGSDTITLKQVAGMTSGLFDFTESDSIQRIWATQPLRILTQQELLSFGLAYPPYFGPGLGCRYSCTNSLIMGMIIEKVTDHTLSETYRSRIFEPLVISNTTFPENQFMPFYAPYAHGYVYTDTTTQNLVDVSERYDPSWAWASANLVSDMSDLQTLLEAMVGGSLLSDSVQHLRIQMTDWQTVHGIPLKYGLGIMGTSGYYGHLGDIQGYHCIGLLDPGTGRTIIVMVTNGSASPLLMFAQIANLLTPGLIPVQ